MITFKARGMNHPLLGPFSLLSKFEMTGFLPEAYLGPCQTFMTALLSENSQWLLAQGYNRVLI